MRHTHGTKPRRARAWVAAVAVLTCVAAGAGAATTTTTTAKADRVSLRAQLGIIYAQNGQVDEARKEFVKLLEEPTGRAAALTNLGNLSMLDGDGEVAVENYTQAAALDTADGGILLNLGLAYRQAGNDDAAVLNHLSRKSGLPQSVPINFSL